MKLVQILFAISAMTLAACNNSASNGSSVKDDTSTAVAADAPSAADQGEAASAENPPSQCLGSATAFKWNVLNAVLEDHISGAKMSDITQIGFDFHDPEYQVTVHDQTVKVSCDDSGDDDCQCSVE